MPSYCENISDEEMLVRLLEKHYIQDQKVMYCDIPSVDELVKCCKNHKYAAFVGLAQKSCNSLSFIIKLWLFIEDLSVSEETCEKVLEFYKMQLSASMRIKRAIC